MICLKANHLFLFIVCTQRVKPKSELLLAGSVSLKTSSSNTGVKKKPTKFYHIFIWIKAGRVLSYISQFIKKFDSVCYGWFKQYSVRIIGGGGTNLDGELVE